MIFPLRMFDVREIRYQHMRSVPHVSLFCAVVWRISMEENWYSSLGQYGFWHSLSLAASQKVSYCDLPFALLTFLLPTDELTLDILRGFQGAGAAATIPASVNKERLLLVKTNSHGF